MFVRSFDTKVKIKWLSGKTSNLLNQKKKKKEEVRTIDMMFTEYV